MINAFAHALAAAELAAVDLHAGATATGGREVPMDRIAEPPFRPVYPRYVHPAVVAVMDLPKVKLPPAGHLRAEAARHRARVSRQACEAREAKLTSRHETAKVGGER